MSELKRFKICAMYRRVRPKSIVELDNQSMNIKHQLFFELLLQIYTIVGST